MQLLTWNHASPPAIIVACFLPTALVETFAMALSEDQLAALLNDPRETLAVELKSWMDPSADEGKAKIAKGCLALRNNNGGCLIIGFKNDGTPDECKNPSQLAATFHNDVIQRIVGEFSSELFQVEVQFGQRDGKLYPVIAVPPGVRTPVAAKKNLGSPGKFLVKDHAVYVRSLSSNNTVSSSEARRGDWDRLIQHCFDNREADIGAFVRRHLSASNLDRFGQFFSGSPGPSRPNAIELAKKALDSGHNSFLNAMKERGVTVPQLGFREAAAVIEGQVPQQVATEGFLQKLFVSQPKHTGWPAWVDSRRLRDKADQPTVYDEGWETLLAATGHITSGWPHLDFWRIDPKGIFYLLTALEDDLQGPNQRPQPLTQLDFLLQISRVAEIISVALSFGRSMGCDPSKTAIGFAFRWSKLADRHLSSWAQPQRSVYSRGPARQNEVMTAVKVPLDTPRSAIPPHVEAAVRNLFALFGGMEFSSNVITDIAADALQVRF
jgi:Putative DNA-binding domain